MKKAKQASHSANQQIDNRRQTTNQQTTSQQVDNRKNISQQVANRQPVNQQVNPFTPLFGKVPSVIAGREEIIDSLSDALSSSASSPELCTVLTGVRGSGKTTLLRHLSSVAEQSGWIVASTTAKTGMLEDLLISAKNSASHLVEPASKRKVKQVSVASVGSISWENATVEKTNWRSEITTLLDKLEESNTGILFVIDEVDGNLDEMVQLVCVFQLLLGENKKVALLMAGLPYHVSSLLLGKTTSFLRRAQQFKLGSIPDYSVREAFHLTIQEGGKEIDDEALDWAVRVIDGFPFLLQLLGFRAWRASGDSSEISLENVRQGAKIAKEELKDRIFTSTMQELSEGDREFLLAMNRDADYTKRAEIAKATERDSSWISRYKKRLLVAGVIEEPYQGIYKFSLPCFADYLAQDLADEGV